MRSILIIWLIILFILIDKQKIPAFIISVLITILLFFLEESIMENNIIALFGINMLMYWLFIFINNKILIIIKLPISTLLYLTVGLVLRWREIFALNIIMDILQIIY